MVDVELAKLHTAGLAMVGHTSLSGVQRKISVRLGTDPSTLHVAAEGGQFILKPQAHTYPSLPENEHVTMQLARIAGVATAVSGLVRLKDGSLAYITRRFDRLPNGKKLHQEDFCQLAEKSPKEKYGGSAELCFKLLERYADEAVIEMQKLYRLIAVAWWTGNGDMHLKNLSLLADETGVHRLSPAYDLASTRLVIDDDPLALPVCGKRDGLRRKTWLRLADHVGLPRKAAERVLDGLVNATGEAVACVRTSLLPEDMKDAYSELLELRAETLSR
jgi:serine/threonine-protein kinase HipA